ncbi:MAG: hypothetical protein ACF788_01285 [Novipirellula sp. JB048]
MLSQIEVAAKTADSILSGKSELFISAVLLVGFVAWTMFQQSKDRKDASEKHEKREAEDKKRYDAQNQFHRDMALRNADQLDTMASSLERTSRATEVMASCTKATESALFGLATAQRRDRRAIISVIDASEAKHRGEDDAAIKAIRDARNHLISGEDDVP